MRDRSNVEIQKISSQDEPTPVIEEEPDPLEDPYI